MAGSLTFAITKTSIGWLSRLHDLSVPASPESEHYSEGATICQQHMNGKSKKYFKLDASHFSPSPIISQCDRFWGASIGWIEDHADRRFDGLFLARGSEAARMAINAKYYEAVRILVGGNEV